MENEYDFSNAVRGKFFQPNSKLNMPVYLDKEVLSYLSERAKSKGIEINQLVNELLRKDIALIESVK